MFEGNLAADPIETDPAAPPPISAPSAEEQLHSRCGVYTRLETVRRVLDAIAWTPDADLGAARLLEPSAGDGAFVLEATDRLVASFQAHGRPLEVAALAPRIVAFELLDREAEVARTAVCRRLRAAGLGDKDARSVAKLWVLTRDFLLAPPTEKFTHVAGNPPYCRWSRLPASLRAQYETTLPADVAKGDIFLPFLDRGIEALEIGGLLGFVCSDRWKFMGFAEGFRARRLPQVDVLQDIPVDAASAFVRGVDAYSSELVIKRRAFQAPHAPARRARQVKTLAEAGYRIRVGPALGCTAAFVVDKVGHLIEERLLGSWLDGRDIQDGVIRPASRSVLLMHGATGELIDIEAFPQAAAHLERYRSVLAARAIVRVSKRPWYSPIDRVYASDWARPKLLVPELAREPRAALDLSGAIPSHGVYAVFAPDNDLTALREAWASGGLARALAGKAPTVKGGYIRCYKRFLEALPAPAG